ncbi:CinA family protein, partial [Paracoccaceae bacterium]|nr:CinA family protein [Paracoccaceae bacterium]
LITAESCTGGLLSANITGVAGSSAVFSYGIICYSNESKRKFLNVDDKTLKSYGAVSFETAREMLAGLCGQAKSKTLTIAISGVAGPSGSESKPVGLVFIGVKISSHETEVITEYNFGNIERNKIQQKSVHEALKMSLDILKNV